VAALAGRRIDAPKARRKQFPEANVPKVKDALSRILREHRLQLLACSAACGADLIALQTALDIGIRCRVVLPFSPLRFRETSVVDRPGDWGPLFDRVIADVKRTGDLIVLKGSSDESADYHHANEVIVREIEETSASEKLAIVVWEGRPRNRTDATESFRSLAHAAGMTELVVATT
jgi:hypothetical protein